MTLAKLFRVILWTLLPFLAVAFLPGWGSLRKLTATSTARRRAYQSGSLYNNYYYNNNIDQQESAQAYAYGSVGGDGGDDDTANDDGETVSGGSDNSDNGSSGSDNNVDEEDAAAGNSNEDTTGNSDEQKSQPNNDGTNGNQSNRVRKEGNGIFTSGFSVLSTPIHNWSAIDWATAAAAFMVLLTFLSIVFEMVKSFCCNGCGTTKRKKQVDLDDGNLVKADHYTAMVHNPA